MPRPASASNICAATPGLVRMPTPTTLTLQTLVLVIASLKPIFSCAFWRTSVVCASDALGTVNVISASWPATGVLCTIMSTLIPASASGAKMDATVPGRSGMPVRVMRASFLS